MSYSDVNTPVIERITLPSGNSYYIADREIRDVVDALSQTVAGGVSFIIAWDGASTPQVAQIPAGVTVIYNDTSYTGTLSAETTGAGAHAQAGAFYLVKSGTQPQLIVDTNGPITNLQVNAATFANATNYSVNTLYEFKYIGTSWYLSPDTTTPVNLYTTYGIEYDGTPTTGSTKIIVQTPSSYIDVYEEYVPVGADGSKKWEKIGDTLIDLRAVVTDVSLVKYTDNVIGANSTLTASNPTVTLSTGSTGDIDILTGSTGLFFTASASGTAVTPTTTNIKATASGGSTAWNSKDQKAAITALGTPSTESAVKSVTPTTKKLATTTVTGVSGSTTPSVIQSRTSQTTADGTGTASSTNTDWLKGVSVTNGVLTIGAATLDTQTTYSADAPGTITVPTAASSATTVATGSTTTTGSGADIVTDVSVGDTFSAVTGYSSPTTANVIGADSTFTITQPTVGLATGATAGTGVISVATGISSVTQPTVQLSTSSDRSQWTDVNEVQYISGVTQAKASAAASGTTVSWNSKDQKTVLNNSTDVSVFRGGDTD